MCDIPGISRGGTAVLIPLSGIKVLRLNERSLSEQLGADWGTAAWLTPHRCYGKQALKFDTYSCRGRETPQDRKVQSI